MGLYNYRPTNASFRDLRLFEIRRLLQNLRYRYLHILIRSRVVDAHAVRTVIMHEIWHLPSIESVAISYTLCSEKNTHSHFLSYLMSDV